MYCDKENINILTALLLAHGIRQAVVCPGSRNAPIVHNLHEAGLCCHAVTDERSAGFYALGMALATKEAVAVCVTSGTALLNLAPSVAEAFHQRVPLLVLSADRPEERIGQLDAQTLRQPGAFGPFVTTVVSLPEPHDSASRIHCNRMVNKALLALKGNVPVHINVPISEPLFSFTTPTLPQERTIAPMQPKADLSDILLRLRERIEEAERPMVVIGQLPFSRETGRLISRLRTVITTIAEPLSATDGGVDFDALYPQVKDRADLAPDFILHLGTQLVSKRLRQFLTAAPGAETWAVSPDGELHDTFRNLTAVIQADPDAVMTELTKGTSFRAPRFKQAWSPLLAPSASPAQKEYSEALAIQLLFEKLSHTPPSPVGEGWGEGSGDGCSLHVSNSSPVRLALAHARNYIYVNRGVNGIEGSLSTAAGFSLASAGLTVCVTGDLSFFYDTNALWNQELDGRLRILLLNNGGGAIFRTLPGLEQSAVSEQYIRAAHSTSARGICLAHRVGYLSASNEAELRAALGTLLSADSPRPMLLEAFF